MARRKFWNPDDMQKAMEAVFDEKLSISVAEQHFYVPHMTLDDRMKELIQDGTNPGPNTVLSAEEEEALVQYLVYMAKRDLLDGYGICIDYIAKTTGSTIRFNLEYGPGKHWWSNLRNRHPE